MKIPISPQNSSKICIFKILINYLKKSNGPNLFFLHFLKFYLTCFTTVPIFESIGPLVAEIWGGGGPNQPPPPPMDSSPRNNPMGIGLIWKNMLFIFRYVIKGQESEWDEVLKSGKTKNMISIKRLEYLPSQCLLVFFFWKCCYGRYIKMCH